jgi:hypothetical protein
MEDFKAKFKSYRHKIIAKGEVVLLDLSETTTGVPHFLMQDTSWNVLRNG